MGRRVCGAEGPPACIWRYSTADLLYARVDLIGGPDNPLLLELEMVEPSLGWQLAAEARSERERNFAVCVESALGSSGSARDRIDAHSAAVAAVHAAAPATCKPPDPRAHR